MLGHPIKVSDEVAALHRDALVFDLHNDVLTKLTHSRYDFGRRHGSAAVWNPLRLDLDIPRIRAAGIDALGCLMFAGFRLSRQRRFWRQLDRARRLAADHPEHIVLARSAADVRAARAADRIALVLGVEGAYALGEDFEPDVRRLAEAGVRTLGPMWERANRFGLSCRDRDDHGLTDAGRALVRACDRAGIRLDVSHASRKTFWDMAEASVHPVFSSHSGASGAYAHPRNLDDDQIREIARRGGVIGVIFVSTYLGGTFCALPRLADHIEHVARVGGEGAVALGSDFDGFMALPRGMRDAADLPRLTQVLWDRGWRGPALRKLLGENVLRYFDQATS